MMSRPKKEPRYNQQFFRQWGGPGPLAFGLIAVVLLIVGLYLAFTKTIPFTSPGYEVKATFSNAVNIAEKSPVRIAGINVGKVTSLEPDGNNTVVTFTVDQEGRPIRSDASAQIRPRLFLEGNWFIDLDPGTPGSEELEDNGMIPVSRTSTSVQVGDILRTLQIPQRAEIQQILKGLGGALNDRPTAEEDVTFEPLVQGKTGGEALNIFYQYGERAARGTAIVNEAYLGERPGDLGNLLRGLTRVTGAVNERGDDLVGFVDNFATFTGALAAESDNLALTINRLAPTLSTARTALSSLNRGLPALRGFAIAATPGLNELPRTIREARPLTAQLKPLLTNSELGGLATVVRRSAPASARSAQETLKLFPKLRLFGLCVADNLVPTGDQVIQDGSLGNGQPAHREFFYAAANALSSSSTFDGNGPYIRVQPGGGTFTVKANDQSETLPEFTTLYGRTPSPVLGTSPIAGGTPPLVTNESCYTQDVPDLNGPAAGPGAPNPVVYP